MEICAIWWSPTNHVLGGMEMKNKVRVGLRRFGLQLGILSTISALASSSAFATGTGGNGLPWEGALSTLQKSLSGPVAGAIAIIALVAIGVTLVFGGEWNEFARRAIYAVCAIAFIMSAATLLGGLFTNAGAVVATLHVHAPVFGALLPFAIRG